MHGLLMVTDMTELIDSDKRLFRKKRRQVAKRTSLKRLKNGVYLLPIEDPRNLSSSEIEAFEKVEDLMNHFDVKVNYFLATQVEIDSLTLESDGMKCYFVLRPIRKLRE